MDPQTPSGLPAAALQSCPVTLPIRCKSGTRLMLTIRMRMCPTRPRLRHRRRPKAVMTTRRRRASPTSSVRRRSAGSPSSRTRRCACLSALMHSRSNRRGVPSGRPLFRHAKNRNLPARSSSPSHPRMRVSIRFPWATVTSIAFWTRSLRKRC